MSAQEQNDQQKRKEIRAVILDYDLVLCRPPRDEHVDRMATAFGVDHHTFWRLYEQNRAPLDKAEITPATYWKSVARDAGKKVDAFTIERLEDLDIDSWDTIEEPLLEWLQTLKANGYKTALLSNSHLRFVAHLRQNRPWLRVFDVCVFSCEVRMIKPDPAIFRLTLEKLGVDASGVLFIDDRVSNVTVARSLRIESIKFTTPIQLNGQLKEAGFPHLVRMP
ncbi:MAG TPA: HAD family phosphatase [Candidatus Acidoferrum sp.]|nr:HAD family phosphatase [Candidatus Acidoferrum sp.]